MGGARSTTARCVRVRFVLPLAPRRRSPSPLPPLILQACVRNLLRAEPQVTNPGRVLEGKGTRNRRRPPPQDKDLPSHSSPPTRPSLPSPQATPAGDGWPVNPLPICSARLPVLLCTSCQRLNAPYHTPPLPRAVSICAIPLPSRLHPCAVPAPWTVLLHRRPSQQREPGHRERLRERRNKKRESSAGPGLRRRGGRQTASPYVCRALGRRLVRWSAVLLSFSPPSA